MGKHLSGKYGLKLFDTTTGALKTFSKKAIHIFYRRSNR